MKALISADYSQIEMRIMARALAHHGEKMKVILDLTADEASAIHQSELPLSSSVREALRAAVLDEHQRLADIQSLTEMRNRATTYGERHRLGKLIESKGGPKSRMCRCGTIIEEANEGWTVDECDDCYAKGYGK